MTAAGRALPSPRRMTPDDFIAEWQANTRGERAA